MAADRIQPLLVLTALTFAGAARAAGPTCARVLGDAEVKAIAATAEAVEPVVYGPGHTECSWIVAKGEGAVMFTVWEKAGIEAFPVPVGSAAEFFEMIVKSSEDTRGGKRQTLPKVGVRAAVVRDGVQRLIYVQSRSGSVAQLVLESLTEQQATALIAAISDL
jgi:hypothetical protein